MTLLTFSLHILKRTTALRAVIGTSQSPARQLIAPRQRSDSSEDLGDSTSRGSPGVLAALSLGFSAPASVTYVPPTLKAADSAFRELVRAGAPISICDAYAEPTSLDRVFSILRPGRLLTHKHSVKADGITEVWARAHEIEVLVVPKLHDRFVVGSRRAFLVGASLNGLGNSHSFLIELDAVMQERVEAVFAELWATSEAAW
jgi:hypothetical protein